MAETIAAIATAMMPSGIGIVRISGPKSRSVFQTLTNSDPIHRLAHLKKIRDRSGCVLDQAILIFFEGPNSFTGDDVLEIHAHGSPILLNMILEEILFLGVRLARPGEFSERAFLSGKIDLLQAEAIADIIESGSTSAVRASIQSLQGAFSEKVNLISEQVYQCRVYLEACIDFADDLDDRLYIDQIMDGISKTIEKIEILLSQAENSLILRSTPLIVLLGLPNAGKSSIMNAMTGSDVAIVHHIAGTTRDVIKEQIRIKDYAVTLLDTAGLHETENEVEQAGIDRAVNQAVQADIHVWVQDVQNGKTSVPSHWRSSLNLHDRNPIFVWNKSDLLSDEQREQILGELGPDECLVSANQKQGIDRLQELILSRITQNHSEVPFLARSRHLDLLRKTLASLQYCMSDLSTDTYDLLAEELKKAHDFLGEMTGKISNDELLGKIFSSFCLGK